eukprot:6196971-Pleurochrysis_carterae.AAC.1
MRQLCHLLAGTRPAVLQNQVVLERAQHLKRHWSSMHAKDVRYIRSPLRTPRSSARVSSRVE